VMHCVLLRMLGSWKWAVCCVLCAGCRVLEATEGEFCLLELMEVMLCALLCMLEAVEVVLHVL